MTTVTEAAKRLGLDPHSLEKAELEDLRRDPVLAQQFARRLASIARDLLPGAALSVEDLRDILEVAVQGARAQERIVEGRYLRKRVREQCAYAERYGESFALVVLRLENEPEPGVYSAAVEHVVEKLRRSDMVTLYRRRVAMLLPRIVPAALDPLVARIRQRLDLTAGQPVVERTDTLVYPSELHRDTQSVLDWLEDALRTD
ncbi:hypothetical protein [Sandaracinus amylolyticus]|uniref:GGDEF domain-containing protein n=1 Tax=Sandaracinus amylolyticus TaxID=927083 RepID=A0A0F6SFB0_9BACT|nr:hypothetical protein [Sandaracinus amylolyticus]AKF06629.1 hypothetical protein DB32_003778 [Sandaracinus amylolyticus]